MMRALFLLMQLHFKVAGLPAQAGIRKVWQLCRNDRMERLTIHGILTSIKYSSLGLEYFK
jgi:hypothetical protein